MGWVLLIVVLAVVGGVIYFIVRVFSGVGATLGTAGPRYLPSDRWEELLSLRDGLPPLHLVDVGGELWLAEKTTGQLVNLGNTYLRRLGIWSAHLRGTNYRTGDIRRAQLVPGQALELRREPDNPYDRNAVAVYGGGHLIGYYNKQMAAGLSKALDGGAHLEAILLGPSMKVIAASPAVMQHLHK